MESLILRVITAFKRRLFKKLKRRSPIDRLRARQYYKRHKNKIRLQRRRYQHKTSPFSKTKKFFKRAVPAWMKTPKNTPSVKPKGPKKSPLYKPKYLRTLLKKPVNKLKKLIKKD